jgi:hypothetical protein
MTALPESHESLVTLAASPLIWALHLLLSYATAAIFCAKAASPDASLAVVQLAIGAYTLASLVTVSVLGVRGFFRHRYGTSSVPHDADSRADRHRFLGFAALLLSGLSAIAIVFQALTVVFIGSCR